MFWSYLIRDRNCYFTVSGKHDRMHVRHDANISHNFTAREEKPFFNVLEKQYRIARRTNKEGNGERISSDSSRHNNICKFKKVKCVREGFLITQTSRLHQLLFVDVVFLPNKNSHEKCICGACVMWYSWFPQIATFSHFSTTSSQPAITRLSFKKGYKSNSLFTTRTLLWGEIRFLAIWACRA